MLPSKIVSLFKRYIHFLKFLLVGGINTLFGYLIYAFFVFAVHNRYASVALATIVAMFFSFFTYGSIVFKAKNKELLGRFFIYYLTMMMIQMIFLKGLEYIGVSNSYLAGAILLPPMAGLSFLLIRRFVFKPQSTL